MKKISADKYVEGVNSIYVEQPTYRTGGDGSDGTCDCIGMGRGALEREGVTDITGMNGTNYAARHTILNLQKIKKASQLRKGDVVLKVRDKDDKDMPLPDQYRKKGNDYNKTWKETNFTHYGTVIQTNPIRICHMTTPTAKIDTDLGNWTYFGQLPWVEYGEEGELPDVRTAMVYAESGSTVKMRQKPSSLCRMYWDVPIGSRVIVMDPGDKWSEIIWAGRTGYMMTKYLRTQGTTYTVVISGLELETAQEICGKYKNAKMEEEVG